MAIPPRFAPLRALQNNVKIKLTATIKNDSDIADDASANGHRSKPYSQRFDPSAPAWSRAVGGSVGARWDPFKREVQCCPSIEYGCVRSPAALQPVSMASDIRIKAPDSSWMPRNLEAIEATLVVRPTTRVQVSTRQGSPALVQYGILRAKHNNRRILLSKRN